MAIKLFGYTFATLTASLILGKVLGKMTDKATSSRYPVEFEVPRDKKGRINYKYDFEPGKGEMAEGETSEDED